MADWRSQQIGLGVTRCPHSENELMMDLGAKPLSDAEIEDIKRRWIERPTPLRASPMVGELGIKIKTTDRDIAKAVIRWIKRQR